VPSLRSVRRFAYLVTTDALVVVVKRMPGFTVVRQQTGVRRNAMVVVVGVVGGGVC
jgi:hypothetical protein